jgi:hypothetical protein
MSFKNASRVIGALATVFLLQGFASAATVGAGVFDAGGTLTITTTSLDFFLNGTGNNAIGIDGSGAFSGLSTADTLNIKNINTPMGGSVPITDFITVPGTHIGGTDIALDLQTLPIITNLPVCTGTSSDDVQGFSCRAIPGSPVVLTQGVGTVTALLNADGQAHYVGSTTLTPFVGKFSANFTADGLNTISALLGSFKANGFVSTGYEVNVSTVPGTVTPEPASLALLGAGLLGLGLLGKKKLAK